MVKEKKSGPRFWLMKTEPDTFSYDDLVAAPGQTTPWDGVRNYQVRNLLRDDFKVGDQVFIYHSSCAEPGIVGVGTVASEGYPDLSALNKKSPYYDESAAKKGESPWIAVDIKAKGRFSRLISLKELRADPAVSAMLLLRKGSRLSVQPVTPEEWKHINTLAKLVKEA